MPSGFTTGGVDLDDVFDPYLSGTKPAVTGYTVGGQDLADRYQPIGAATPAADTGYTTAGVDLSQLFAPLGAGGGVDATPDWDGVTRTNFSYGLSENSARLRLNFAPNGSVGIFASDFTGGTWSMESSGFDGSWFLPEQAGAGDDYEIRFTDTAEQPGGDIVNGAIDWASLATGRDYTLTVTKSTATGPIDARYHVLAEIREVATGTVIASGTVTLHVHSEIS